MAITKTTCYLAECDGCGEQWEDEYVVHHESRAAAIDYAMDNERAIIIGETVYCESCARHRNLPAHIFEPYSWWDDTETCGTCYRNPEDWSHPWVFPDEGVGVLTM